MSWKVETLDACKHCKEGDLGSGIIFQNEKGTEYEVSCFTCGHTTKTHSTLTEAVRAWNEGE